VSAALRQAPSSDGTVPTELTFAPAPLFFTRSGYQVRVRP